MKGKKSIKIILGAALMLCIAAAVTTMVMGQQKQGGELTLAWAGKLVNCLNAACYTLEVTTKDGTFEKTKIYQKDKNSFVIFELNSPNKEYYRGNKVYYTNKENMDCKCQEVKMNIRDTVKKQYSKFAPRQKDYVRTFDRSEQGVSYRVERFQINKDIYDYYFEGSKYVKTVMVSDPDDLSYRIWYTDKIIDSYD